MVRREYCVVWTVMVSLVGTGCGPLPHHAELEHRLSLREAALAAREKRVGARERTVRVATAHVRPDIEKAQPALSRPIGNPAVPAQPAPSPIAQPASASSPAGAAGLAGRATAAATPQAIEPALRIQRSRFQRLCLDQDATTQAQCEALWRLRVNP